MGGAICLPARGQLPAYRVIRLSHFHRRRQPVPLHHSEFLPPPSDMAMSGTCIVKELLNRFTTRHRRGKMVQLHLWYHSESFSSDVEAVMSKNFSPSRVCLRISTLHTSSVSVATFLNCYVLCSVTVKPNWLQ